jgi:hypothetical protein
VIPKVIPIESLSVVLWGKSREDKYDAMPMAFHLLDGELR